MIRKLTYLIIAAASLLLAACGIYDDDMYGPNGEQKVKISFVLALGSSDTPVTKAGEEYWRPDGYGDDVIGNDFDNTILLNSLQIVFFTESNQYYTRVNVDTWEKLEPEQGETVSNRYQFNGHAWVDEEYVTDPEKKLKMMVFANIDEEVNFLTDIEAMTFKGVKKDRVLAVDDSKVKLFCEYMEAGLDGNPNYYSSRIDLCNVYSGESPTYNDPPFALADLHFTKRMKITFTVKGTQMPAASYDGRLLYSDAGDRWCDGSFIFTGDGTYEVECNIDEATYHSDHSAYSMEGTKVLLIDIEGTHSGSGEQVFYNGQTTVTIDQILLQDHQEYIPMWGVKTVSFTKDGAVDMNGYHPEIYVLRAMSKIEVDLSQELKDKGYTLSGMQLNSVNERGFCLPAGAKTKTMTEELELVSSFKENTSVPLTDFALAKRDKVAGEDDEAFAAYLKEPMTMYVPERRNSGVASTINVTIRRNVNGAISEIVPQQAIEFKTYTDGQATGAAYDIYRNHNYRFVITGVSTGGLRYHLVKIEDLELGGRYGFEF